MDVCVIALSAAELALSFYCLWLFFKMLPRALFLHLLMFGGFWFYCAGGTMLAYLALASDDISILLMRYNITHDDIFYALILSLAFGLIIHFLAMRFPKAASIPTPLLVSSLQSVAMNRWVFSAVSLSVIAISAVLVLTGKMVFHGTESAEGGLVQSDPLMLTVQPLYFVVGLLCGFRLFAPKRLWFTTGVLLAVVPFVLAEGRRELIEFIFTVLLGFSLNRTLKVALNVKLAFLAAMVCVGTFGFFMSIALKTAGHLEHTANPAIVGPRAVDLLLHGEENSANDIVSKTQKNTNTRGINPALFLALLISADRSNTGTGGDILVNALYTTIPSALWPYKDAYVQSEEAIAGAGLRLSITQDMGNTALSGAYTDFREAGILIYGVLIFFMIIFASYLFRAAKMPIFKVLIFTDLLLTTISVEGQMSAWLLMFRFMLQYIILDFLLYSLLRIKNPVSNRIRPRAAGFSYTGGNLPS